jgi:hypothetical protein
MVVEQRFNDFSPALDGLIHIDGCVCSQQTRIADLGGIINEISDDVLKVFFAQYGW